LAVGVTLTTGEGVTLTTGEGVGVGLGEGFSLTTGEGVGVTLTTGEGVGVTLTTGEGVGVTTRAVAVAPAACCACKQNAMDEAAMTITKDNTRTREMRILDPPACNDNY
jgi:cobalamin biosynthesis protein CbiD